MALPTITLEITNADRVAIQHAIWPIINKLEAKPVSHLNAESLLQLTTLRRLNSRLTIPSN